MEKKVKLNHVNPKCYFESITERAEAVMRLTEVSRKPPSRRNGKITDDAYCTHVNDLIFHSARRHVGKFIKTLRVENRCDNLV